MSTNNSRATINISEWVSQADAARIRAVSRQAIYKLVKNGRLRCLEVGGHILVNRSDVENFQSLQPGRPKVNKK